MSWVRRILLYLGVLILVLVAAAYLLPRRVRVERSATIAAPRTTVFAIVNSFKPFNKWSPWFDLDPNAKYTYEGPAAGVGAKMTWVGNPSTLGSGSQVITASQPFERVTADVDFGQGGAPAKQVITLASDGKATKVDWGIEVDLGMNPISRYFGLMFDGMIGKDFEKGLAGLKKFAEQLPGADFSGLQVEIATVPPVTIAFVRASSVKDDKSVAAAIEKAYGEVSAFMKAQKLSQAGPPVAIDTGKSGAEFVFDAAVPIDKAPENAIPAGSPVRVKQTAGGKILKVATKGPHSEVAAAYEKALAYMAVNGIETNGYVWYEYASDPKVVKESEALTNICFPIK